MITIGDKQYRNLEEQVKKNMDDIQYILEEEGVLNEFGIKVVGQITDSSQLPDPGTYQGEYGDAYAVGTDAPYTIYIYTRANSNHPTNYWFNIGQFPAPSTVPGPTGPQGPKGDSGTRGSTWTNGTSNPTTTSGYIANDKYLNTTDGSVFNYNGSTWQNVGNIRGPQGIQGPQGNVGPAGQQGIQGPKGDTGPAGPAFVIAGKVANEGQLPAPSTLADNIAYLVGSDADGYDLYVQLQDTQTWQNVGKVEGVQGPPGPQGEQGPQGIQGIQGIQGEQGVGVQNVVLQQEGDIIVPDNRLKNFLFSFRLRDSDGRYMYVAGSKLINTTFNSFSSMMEGKDVYLNGKPTSEQLENIWQFLSWVFDTSYGTGTVYEPGIPCHGIFTEPDSPQDSIEICTAGYRNNIGSRKVILVGGYDASRTFTSGKIDIANLTSIYDEGCRFVPISGDFN